ncbi:accessory gene regulator B family protein [Paenibacillus graminis]|uniref:accessory gene regulator B family protein n=1 Tax=Paenibacillus graminis TaxID=189425 RepID=UPI002DBEC285|nr:accessory gene regulator B family protein [Paenibacillus graminis]MEC0168141.1 accessory gene regulator B family protein [Paenibacillus graminis]
MIDRTALMMAQGIKDKIPDHPASIAVLKFSIAIIINTVSIITLTLLVSIFTGNTKEAAIALIAFAILRQVSGGKHLNSNISCILVTTTLFTAISFVEMNSLWTKILTVLSLVLVLLFAPSSIEKQSRIPKKYYPLLKVISSLLIIMSFYISVPALTLTFFIQSLTLIPLKGGENNEKNRN